jgi:Ca2+-binding RTX toxin-like protein
MLARSLLSGLFIVATLYAAPLGTGQAVPTCFGQPATIVGTSGNDTIQGTDGADVIVGGGGEDRIDGAGGDDLICAGGLLRGGDGNDKLHGGPKSDFIDAGNGDDLLVEGGETAPVGANLMGGPGNDRLIGAAGNDALWPGPGFDLVRGRGGSDSLRYDLFPGATRGVTVDLNAGRGWGEGRDILFGVESVVGTPFDDVLFGNGANNGFAAGDGNNVVRGRAGDDGLASGTGQDRLYGGRGNDTFGGGGGRDVAYGYGGDDIFYMAEPYGGEEPSRDVLWGGSGSDKAEVDSIDRLHSIEHPSYCC